MTRWQKERLKKQLEFFGAKKTRFISCYAKKPRIKLKIEPKADALCRQQAIAQQALVDARGIALYQQQTQLVIQNSAFGINQMQQLSGLMGMSNGADIAQVKNPFIRYTGGWLL